MGGGKGQIEKERLIYPGFLEERNRFITNRIGKVVILVIHEFMINGISVSLETERCVKATCSTENPVKVIEAALVRINRILSIILGVFSGEVPLAHHPCPVTIIF